MEDNTCVSTFCQRDINFSCTPCHNSSSLYISFNFITKKTIGNLFLWKKRESKDIAKIGNFEFLENSNEDFEMGSDMVHISPSRIEDCARKPCI